MSAARSQPPDFSGFLTSSKSLTMRAQRIKGRLMQADPMPRSRRGEHTDVRRNRNQIFSPHRSAHFFGKLIADASV